jgi:hypothetical protein
VPVKRHVADRVRFDCVLGVPFSDQPLYFWEVVDFVLLTDQDVRQHVYDSAFPGCNIGV